jgi:hypothetical protein
MARFATIDANNNIVGFTPAQQIYNPLKGDLQHPAPWRSLPAPVVPQPDFDPATQAMSNTLTVGPTSVIEEWTIRALTQVELDAIKDQQVSGMEIVAGTVLFNHENRIRALEGKAAITKAQFLTALKGLL